ncbi:MAG: hypothetical protein AAFY83_13785 [Pseudomonadota bacterium]
MRYVVFSLLSIVAIGLFGPIANARQDSGGQSALQALIDQYLATPDYALADITGEGPRIPEDKDAATGKSIATTPASKPEDEPGAAPSNEDPATPTSNETPRRVSLIYQALPRYEACIAGVRDDLSNGLIKARRWVSDGGGPPAIHCLAIAELAGDTPRLAAIRLSELAERPAAGDAQTRATISAQAAEVFLGLNRPDAALDALTPAFALAPDAGDLFALAARIHVARRRWQQAVDAVDQAEALGFRSLLGLVARARGLKELTQFELAAEDVAAALRIDPFFLDALVLRGELAQTGIQINTNFRRREPPLPVAPD